MVETKGMDYLDKEKAKRAAKEQCDQVIVKKENFPE